MKPFKVFLALALLFFLGSIFLFFWPEKRSPEAPSWAVLGSEKFALEIADTDEERAKGLGYRDSLCEGCAMLFLFDTPKQHAFWMKGMRFPLDIIWLQGTEVVFVARSLSPDSLQAISPPKPADRVLEVHAGRAAGIQEGDHIEFR